MTDFGSTRIGLGINDWDFVWRLNPGRPSRRHLPGWLHDWRLWRRFPHPPRLCPRRTAAPRQALHPVLYNSWEAVFFDVNEESQIAVAELAAQMGVELFVMDDGWFHRRTIDNAGLGDWWPDAVKFPNGIKPLIDRVNALGMDFGLWLEPEMVNPDSDLYRAHPDWVIHFPNRARTEMRNQLILNLGRTDVQEYLIDLLDKLLSAHNITFIKWDMNRNVSEPGWPDAPGDAREIWVRYVQGLYHVWGTLKQRHPNILWQSCSGGGGRVDLGMLQLVDQFWVSDNTEAVARLGIQEGFSQIMPAITMESQVTDMGHAPAPLEFRFHVSMMGVLGISSDLLKWTAEERALGAQLIAQYKELRPLVQLGDQYRLLPAQGSTFTAVQYMSKDKQAGVFFAFRTHIPEPVSLAPVYLRGLEPTARYTVDGFPGVRSGQAWMNTGLQLELKDLQSTLRWIRRVDG